MNLDEITNVLYSLRSNSDNLLFKKLENEHLYRLSSSIFIYLTEKDIHQERYDINFEIHKKFQELNKLRYFYSISRFNNELSNLITSLDCETILLLMGLRKTFTSITDETGLPPLKRLLIKSANQIHKERLTVAAKALSKHSNRSEFWGEVRGKTGVKNREAIEIVARIIDEQVWWNKYRHSRDEIIYEVRIVSGHGCRWNGDGSKFIGFVEPIDERSESIFSSE
jgi:hypothetical protein